MFRSFFIFTILVFSQLSAHNFRDYYNDCGCRVGYCGAIDVELGWRRDYLNWKTKDLCKNYLCGKIDDRLFFKDINSYTVAGQLRWISQHYYVRASAEYGFTDKGRAIEHFKMKSPDLICCPLEVNNNDPVKRRSEVYDFDGAVGYPFLLCCDKFMFVPLIGFSYHRQHLRVKEHVDSSSCCCNSDYLNSCEFFQCHSSDSFFVDSYNAIGCEVSSNPFASSSSSNIASNIGLKNPHNTDTYRFTWYGFYVGADMAYALDCCWTLFWNTEIHFLDNCHRKRKSWTGVFCVDDYHKRGGAYGFNNVVGVNWSMDRDWFATLSVDFDWWRAHSRNDELVWKKVGVKAGLAYTY